MARSKVQRGQLRIIGGRWRGRRLSFPALEGLRPTPDRVRETLFNWLAPIINGARCLDLFAGSGALGIEALSRGASETVFIERHPLAARQLRENLMLLGVESPRVIEAEALAWLTNHQAMPFDLALLDPPFANGLMTPICKALEQCHWLTPEARIYLESEYEPQDLSLPANWQVLKAKKAGQVAYSLLCRQLAQS